MIINSENIEFGYELVSVIPYANYLNSIGELEKTISGNDTECLYFFSPNHEINPAQRNWYNTPKVNYPNIDIHKPFLKKEQFLVPDYKTKFANKKYKFKKETIIICNRHNSEWGKKPINFFSLECLTEMFELLQDEYQLVYINIEGRPELYDNASPDSLGDFELLKKYPKVYNIHDLHKKNKKISFNTLQLMLFANCEKYITMNGGHALLSAYFGGENILMSKRGNVQPHELNTGVNSFYRWYHKFNGQRVVLVNDEKSLINRIKLQWIDKEPIVNILIRTSSRPNYFKICMDSIDTQTYKNINIFVSIENTVNYKQDYTRDYPVYPVFVDKEENIKPISGNLSYGAVFPYNLYINELQKRVKSGLIMLLDDDDKLSKRNSLQTIVDEYKKGNELLFWRIKSLNRIIPSDTNFGKAPVNLDMSGIGFAFDVKYKENAKWEAYKRGDFRIASLLYHLIEKKSFIDEVLTETQNGQHAGNLEDLKKEETYERLAEIKIEKKELKEAILKSENEWFVNTNNEFWYGHPSLIQKQIISRKFRKVELSEVPTYLINKL